MIVLELVDDLQEGPQCLRVAVGQEGVLEDVAEERRDAGVLRHLGDGLGVEVQRLMSAQAGAHELGPTVAGVCAGEELAVAAQLFGVGVHVIHELVDECNRNLLDLTLGVGHLAYEDVTGGVDAPFGISVEHADPGECAIRRRR